MKKGFIYYLLIMAVLASCKKENISPTGLQVSLSVTTYYKDGSMETRKDRSGILQKISYGQVINDGGINKFLVNLGAFAINSTPPVFGISFVFNQQYNPNTINGTYTFPANNATIRVTLRNEVSQTITENIFFPARGTVSFSYDPVAKKISGAIEDMEFSIIPNDPYNRYRVTVKGTFKNIPLL